MQNDNTTPISASEYDNKINKTIPFYKEFYEQTIDMVVQCQYNEINWLDLGCGTGTLELEAQKHFPSAKFVLVDPSEKMLEQAKQKLGNEQMEYCLTSSDNISFSNQFQVVTAIQSHHYFNENEREEATKRVYRALMPGGIYITFENVIPEDEETKQSELLRWGRYQQRQGKTAEEAKEHNARCGKNYFPLTVSQHIDLLKKSCFGRVYVFWKSYMQMGICAFK